jgi:hypothetical protein
MSEPAAIRIPRRARAVPNYHLWFGASLLGVFVVVAILGAAIAPYDPNAQDLFALLEPPSAAHWLGTDNVGRDILSRLIVGTRYTLSVALASVFFAGLGGVALGAVAGYFGGTVDRIVTGVIDLLLTVPNIVLAIAIASVAGSSAVGPHDRDHGELHSPARAPRARPRGGDRGGGFRRGLRQCRHEPYPHPAAPCSTQCRDSDRHRVEPQRGPSRVDRLGARLSRSRRPAARARMGHDAGGKPRISDRSRRMSCFAPGIAISLLVLAFNMPSATGLRDVFDPSFTRLTGIRWTTASSTATPTSSRRPRRPSGFPGRGDASAAPAARDASCTATSPTGASADRHDRAATGPLWDPEGPVP